MPISLQPRERKAKSRGEARKILKLAIPISLESVFQMGFNAIELRAALQSKAEQGQSSLGSLPARDVKKRRRL